MNRRGFWVVRAASVCVAVVWSTFAHASPTYPDEVKQHWGLVDLPECTLCHTNDLGGTGTVTTPFGRSLLSEGAHGGSDLRALDAALDALRNSGRDSDGDGVSDFDELNQGKNPNDPSDAPPPSDNGGAAGADGNAPRAAEASLPIPETGCALTARLVHTRTGSGFGSLVALWLVVRRRRARKR